MSDSHDKIHDRREPKDGTTKVDMVVEAMRYQNIHQRKKRGFNLL